MKIAMINATTTGSTGTIMLQIAACARNHGHTVYTFSPATVAKSPLPSIDGHTYFGSYRDRRIHNYLGKLLGLNGLLSRHATKQLVRSLQKRQVEVVHLHNLHDFCIHLPTLFHYLKKNNIRVVWTLHDCWSFTGHCPHFEAIGCDRWQTECHSCSQLRAYPASYVDHSRRMYRRKRRLFTNLPHMMLVTPSGWLADLTRHSFLRDYPVRVIHNGIDLSVFHPTVDTVPERYGIPADKPVLLGVASLWTYRKGNDVMIELAKQLPEYTVVAVGGGQWAESCPDNMIVIGKTANRTELAALYTRADVFVNPTREDTYPTVNMEALACGTPVVTFQTGGSPEILDESCGMVVPKDDVEALRQAAIKLCEQSRALRSACLARAQSFDCAARFEEYISLYGEMINEKGKKLC